MSGSVPQLCEVVVEKWNLCVTQPSLATITGRRQPCTAQGPHNYSALVRRTQSSQAQADTGARAYAGNSLRPLLLPANRHPIRVGLTRGSWDGSLPNPFDFLFISSGFIWLSLCLAHSGNCPHRGKLSVWEWNDAKEQVQRENNNTLGSQTFLPRSIHYTQCACSEDYECNAKERGHTVCEFRNFGAKKTKHRNQRIIRF